MLVANVAFGDAASVSPLGINSAITGLDGSGVLIGQVEPARSGKDGYDNDDNSASNTAPAGVYFQTSGGMDPPNSSNIGEHATVVAGIMIADEGDFIGVAPNAQLHSAAVGFAVDVVETALTLNRIALLSSGTVRATNLSFIHELIGPVDQPNGNSHLTSFIDWSARQHDLLYVAVWGNDVDFFPRSPADNFNGITVASSNVPEGEFTWRQFGAVNSSEGLGFDDSQNIHLLAPGEFVGVIGPGDQLSVEEGTSLAAPHVTGAVALLQQYALQQIPTNPRFSSNSQRHDVMKAVLMNSADKLSGVHGSARDVIDSNGMNWTQSEAFGNSTIPLDDEMGAGHLNVNRAVQQFQNGEYGSTDDVPRIAWDSASVGGLGSSIEYTFADEIGGYLAATLVWDRRVESTGGNTYGAGDTFFNRSLANLDLQLVTLDGTVVAQSNSESMNFEHIFFDVPSGNYRLRVVHSPGDIGSVPSFTNFALAWWNGDASTPIPGDYDRNGSVGPEDYDVWKTNFGTSFADADGNGDGIVDAADYTVWRDNLEAGSASIAPVPEPSSLALVVMASVMLGWRRHSMLRGSASRAAVSASKSSPVYS
jgi:hypothetical protein